MKNIPLHWIYGLLTGAAVVGWMLFEYAMGWHSTSTGATTSLVWVLFFLVGLALAIRNMRDTVLKGFIDVKLGMLIGLQFALIVGLVSGLGTFIYYQFINPNFAVFWAQKSEAAMVVTHTTPALIAETKQNILATFTPIKQATQRLLFCILGGAFGSVVLSLLLKNTPAE